MKNKSLSSLFIASALCLSAVSALATDEKNKEKIEVFYNDEVINFDVEPVIEDDRTLVPMRAIFETMGCAVYYSQEDGKQIISARRANDNLMLTIGENKMYFNGNEIELDVPAKIRAERTLVPLRAISEAFECEVHWEGETKNIDIYSPANAYAVSTEKIEETITDEEGNVLIEAVAYYPVIENPTGMPCFDAINSDYKPDAEKFIEEARAKKEDALALRKEMGESFKPFVFELTYEQTYSIWGYLSFVNHKYINAGGAHPTKAMESRTYSTSLETEMSVSEIIEEEMLETSLADYITNLFVDKLKEIAPETAQMYTYDYVKEYMGYVQFYLTKNSLVLYFNQGEIAPYALGTVSVEIPYEPNLFSADMRYNYGAEQVLENGYNKGYEWRVFDYTEDKITFTEENADYPPEETVFENYPVGCHKLTVKGIKKGNATLRLAHVKKGEGLESATLSYTARFYVDENNMLTVISIDEDMYLLDGNYYPTANVIKPLPETIDINLLENCTVAVSLEKGDAYIDESGKMVMDATVYSYEIYDMTDIAALKENDVIVRRNEEVKITAIERLQTGLVRINGGEENGGFDLVSDESTVYYEAGMNDVKAYFELGKVTLPVSDAFEYVDQSDLDSAAKTYYPDDFFANESGLEYGFSPNDTSIVIENGVVIKMTKIYTP